MRWLCLCICCCTAIMFGCSHYTGTTPINKELKAQVKGDLAIGGIITRQAATKAAPSLSQEANKKLLDELDREDALAPLSLDDLTLLLSGPNELSVNALYLREMKDRLGHRYVLVGEDGGYPISKYFFWGVGYGIPLGPILIVGNIPIQLSEKHGVQHEKRIMRVIDLEQACIIGESFEVLRDEEDGDKFTSGEISDAVSNLKF